MASPTFLSRGHTPTRTDSTWYIEQRILGALVDGAGGGGGNETGSGSPEGVVTAAPGAGYVDTSNGDLWVKQTGTGNTGWVLVTGAAGSNGVFGGSADPEGSQSATGPAVYLRSEDANGDRRIYVKPSGVAGTTGWTLALTYQV